MRTASLVGLAVLLVVATVLGGATPQVAPTQETPEPDNTVTRIDLAANGSAVWEVQFRTRLETESEVAEYESFQSEFRNDTAAFLDPYRDRIRSVVGNADNETTRPMSAVNFTASTSIQQVPRRFGVVTFQFRWENFTRADGDQLRMGDVFGGGFFVGSNDTLIVTAPADYRIDSVDPEPDDRTDTRVRWTGQVSFSDGRPQVVVSPDRTPTATQTPTATRTTTTVPPTTTPDEASGEVPFVPLLAVGLGLVILAAIAYRRGAFDGFGTPNPDAGDGPPDGGAPGEPTSETATDETTSEPAGDPTNGEAASDPYDAVLADIRPPLTDEDRVRKALAENGGRMRQSDIADRLDWSASKTSRVLSDMADDRQVEKLRVGRQNVIDLVIDEE